MRQVFMVGLAGIIGVIVGYFLSLLFFMFLIAPLAVGNGFSLEFARAIQYLLAAAVASWFVYGAWQQRHLY